MNNMINTITLVLISIGILFNILGCIGLLRLPDAYNRLQAATKCVTLGFSDGGAKALVAIPILFFSSTVAAHALIRGTYHFGVKLSDKSVKDDYKNAAK
jgi:multicomponent Na+:H+ antiporter subunit G